MKEIQTPNIIVKLNEPQVEALKTINKLAKSCRWINIEFRDNGENKIVQADFLREFLKQLGNLPTKA